MQDDMDAEAVDSQTISKIGALLDGQQQMTGASNVTKGLDGTHRNC
jgi:hypothetical protein